MVESHVSKLRKKLRAKLGYDPIESKRYLGYCLEDPCGTSRPPACGTARAPSTARKSVLANAA